MHLRGRGLKLTAVAALVVLSLTGFSTGRHHSRGGSGGGGGCSSSSQDHGGSSSTGGTSGSSSYDDSADDSYSSSGGGSDDSYSSGGSYTSGGSSYNRRPHYRSTPTSSGTGSARAAEDGTARVLSCATRAEPYATVEVSNPNARAGTFGIDFSFADADGSALRSEHVKVKVPANGTATTRVRAGASLIDVLDHCEVDPDADLVD